MTIFRPCIDLHDGQVKQIVGSTLKANQAKLITNFTSKRPSSWFANLFQQDKLSGGHVIMLGPGNKIAAAEALEAYPGGLQVGGGIHLDNAEFWLKKGASHIIVTSWLIPAKSLDINRLKTLSRLVGPERLVLDLSCRKVNNSWFIAKDKWQTITQTQITLSLLRQLSEYCSEFLVHAADVEGRCSGIDKKLVQFLSGYDGRPVTYAGGARSLSDLKLVQTISRGRLDLTIGSALDIFGGKQVRYKDCVDFNRSQTNEF